VSETEGRIQTRFSQTGCGEYLDLKKRQNRSWKILHKRATWFVLQHIRVSESSKSWGMRWEWQNLYRILVRKPIGKTMLGRPRHG
jgi:hypothetical protein